MLGEDFAGELFDFAEGDGFKPARSFEAKAKSSYASKKVQGAQLAHRPSLHQGRFVSAGRMRPCDT